MFLLVFWPINVSLSKHQHPELLWILSAHWTVGGRGGGGLLIELMIAILHVASRVLSLLPSPRSYGQMATVK